MHKLLTMLATVSLFTTTTNIVVSCQDPPKAGVETPEDTRTPLTDEKLEKFFKTTNFSYKGPFIFSPGDKIVGKSTSEKYDGAKMLQHLVLKSIYIELNKHFTYEGYDFKGGRISSSTNPETSYDQNNQEFTFDVSVRYSSPKQKDDSLNPGKRFDFKFTQTKKLEGSAYLEEVFDSFFNRFKFEEKESQYNYIGLGSNAFAGLDRFEYKDFEKIKPGQDQLDFLTKHYISNFNTNDILKNSINIKVLKYKDIGNVNSIIRPDEVSCREFQTTISLSLKNNPKIVIEKTFNDLALNWQG